MGKPSKYEKETIVNFNEGEKEARNGLRATTKKDMEI